MGVSVPIEIRRRDGGAPAVRTAALLNSGFESATPDLLVPAGLATRLQLLPDLPAAAVAVEFSTAGGRVVLHRIPDALGVRVLTGGRAQPETICSAIVSSTENEAILNDSAISALRMEVADPKGGRWRLSRERRLRRGVAAQLW